MGTAEAQVQRAQASLEQARQALGPKGADNPQIRDALAALEQARLDLARTTLRAPGDGVVTNLQLNIGQFAAAGQPALTFLDARLVWLQAFVRENSLEYIAWYAGRGGARRLARPCAAGAGAEPGLGRRRGRCGSHDRPAKDAPGHRRMARIGAALPGRSGV